MHRVFHVVWSVLWNVRTGVRLERRRVARAARVVTRNTQRARAASFLCAPRSSSTPVSPLSGMLPFSTTARVLEVSAPRVANVDRRPLPLPPAALSLSGDDADLSE